MVEELVEAILRCCNLRGDDDANRAALIAEVDDFTPEQRRELTDHFNAEAEIWRTVTGQGGAA